MGNAYSDIYKFQFINELSLLISWISIQVGCGKIYSKIFVLVQLKLYFVCIF